MDKKAVSPEVREEVKLAPKSMEPKDLNCKCYALVYMPWNGFADYAIATLEIQNGKVKTVALSDPYAAFEARARMELWNNQLVDYMMQHYPAGFQHV